MNTIFRWFMLAVTVFCIDLPANEIQKDTPLRTKLIALVEKNTEQIRIATDKLKELNIASGPLGVRLLAEEDFCSEGECDFVTQFSTNFFADGVYNASTNDLINVAVVQRMALHYFIPVVLHMVQEFGQKYNVLSSVFFNSSNGLYAREYGIPNTRIVSSEEVLKAMQADELKTFDHKVGELLQNNSDSDMPVFVACFFRKFRNIIADGFIEEVDDNDNLVLFYVNMFGFDKFRKELLLNPAYAEIWKQARISSDKDAYDSDFFAPFAKAVINVLAVMDTSYQTKVKSLQTTTEQDKVAIDAFAKGVAEEEIAKFAACDKAQQMSGAMLGTGFVMQQYWQTALELLQECLA